MCLTDHARDLQSAMRLNLQKDITKIMSETDLGPLANGPHADLIREMAEKCIVDPRIQAIWVGGSLASGTGDFYSDVDFRIAVEPGQVAQWVSPDWDRYLPLRPYGHVLLRFGENALLHHMVLADGSIIDFFVQDTNQQNFEPSLIVIACRDAAFSEKLAGFARPAASLVRDMDGAVARQFLVDYWITTHKQMKALARKYDQSPFAGLYLERMALLRAYFMQATGKDIDARMSLHMLGVLHKGLEGKLTEEQHNILGAPSRTPAETVGVIEAIRAEMSRVGRALADQHAFEYPLELEDVARRVWNERKEDFTKR